MSLLSNAHQTLVFDDPVQPGPKGAIATELVEALERFPEGVLHLVLRVASVADHQHGAFQASATVPLDQFPKGSCTPCPRLSDQILFAWDAGVILSRCIAIVIFRARMRIDFDWI